MCCFSSTETRIRSSNSSQLDNNQSVQTPVQELSRTDQTLRSIALAIFGTILGAAVGVAIGLSLGAVTVPATIGGIFGMIMYLFIANCCADAFDFQSSTTRVPTEHVAAATTATKRVVPVVNQEASPVINLHLNENPFGCFPSVTAAMKESINSASKYVVDAGRNGLDIQIAAYHSVKREQVLMSTGLASLFCTAAEAFLGPNTTLIMPIPTFEFLKIFAQARGTNVIDVPLTKDFSHDLDAMANLVKANPNTRLVYICNPNNPTGSITPRSKIEEFIKKLPPDTYVLIDEAYHHYAVGAKDYESFIDKPLVGDDRVIVGRSFSKVYGLAGMRLGYAISTEKTMAKLSKLSPIAPHNIAVVCGGSTALKDEAALVDMVQKTNTVRNEFYEQATKRNLNYIPSYANFVMLGTGGRKVQDIIKHFKDHNINIGREFMKDYVRISLGLPDQMKRFWTVWDTMPR